MFYGKKSELAFENIKIKSPENTFLFSCLQTMQTPHIENVLLNSKPTSKVKAVGNYIFIKDVMIRISFSIYHLSIFGKAKLFMRKGKADVAGQEQWYADTAAGIG